jgi:hypothetical protein
VNGRKLAVPSGLLRNSTIFAAQKLGLEQCSQNAPEADSKLKPRPDCSRAPLPPSPLLLSLFRIISIPWIWQ